MSNEIEILADGKSAYEIFDDLDDKQIIAKMNGEQLATWVYSYPDKSTGKEIVGLSKEGVDGAASMLADNGEVIRELELHFTESGADVFFISKSGRYKILPDGREVLLDTKIGQKRQSKIINYKAGGTGLNPFWFEQGGQKALRNSKRDLIPAKYIANMIVKAIESGHVKKIEAPAGNYSEGGNTPEREIFITSMPVDPAYWKIDKADKETRKNFKPGHFPKKNEDTGKWFWASNTKPSEDIPENDLIMDEKKEYLAWLNAGDPQAVDVKNHINSDILKKSNKIFSALKPDEIHELAVMVKLEFEKQFK